MGRFYCDYCHCYLTYDPPPKKKSPLLTSRHDSASVRKAHNLGRNHIQKVREYYDSLGYDKTQSVINALQQDYQSALLPPDAAGVVGKPSSPYACTNRVGGSGQKVFKDLITGGPVPGMPLPPPPNMPLPGGGFVPEPGRRPADTNPFAAALGQLQVPAGITSAGGRIEGEAR